MNPPAAAEPGQPSVPSRHPSRRAILAVALGLATWAAWYLGFHGSLPAPFAPWLALGFALIGTAVAIAALITPGALRLLALIGLALGLLYAVPFLWYIGGALYWNVLHAGG